MHSNGHKPKSSYGMWEVIQDLLLWMQAVKAPRPNVSPANMSQSIQDIIDRVTHEPLAVGTVKHLQGAWKQL